MKSYLRYLIFISLFLNGVFSFGQGLEYMFRCSLKDKQGNVWFGTIGSGVYRYDGVSKMFTHFTVKDGLNDDQIETVYEDLTGNIWFGTPKGACMFDGKSFNDMTEKFGLSKCDINAILQDKNGNFWFATNQYGVATFDMMKHLVKNYSKEDGLGSFSVQCIFEDVQGLLIFGERAGGVSRYDFATDKFVKVDGQGCFSNQIMSIMQDNKGMVWYLNLYSGLCRYDVSSGKMEHLTTTEGLCNDTLTCIYEDSKGNIWLGGGSKWNAGNGRLCRYDGKNFVSFCKDGLDASDVWTIVEDKEGELWVGTRTGLFLYHSPSDKFINYTHKLNSEK